MPLQGSNVIIL